MKKPIAPIRPGEVLLKDLLKLLSITLHRLAASIGLYFPQINEVVRGQLG